MRGVGHKILAHLEDFVMTRFILQHQNSACVLHLGGGNEFEVDFLRIA